MLHAAEWKRVAREWCEAVKIGPTGGFDVEKIQLFEKLEVPVDFYGVGSSLISNCSKCGTNNDFTADVVRVKIRGQWYDLAKVGRKPCHNQKLERIQ